MTLETWRMLPEADKRKYLGWDIRREKELRTLKDALSDSKKLTPEALAILATSL